MQKGIRKTEFERFISRQIRARSICKNNLHIDYFKGGSLVVYPTNLSLIGKKDTAIAV